METALLIRHKHLYRIWFIDLICNMFACFKNSNPTETQTTDSPFGNNQLLDARLIHAMDVILAKNNVNAALKDINRFC